MNTQVKMAIVTYMKDKIAYDIENLGMGMTVLEVTSEGHLPGKSHALPLWIKIRGPADIMDFSLSYIIQTIKDSEREITKNLHQLGDEYYNVSLALSTYDYDELLIGDESLVVESEQVTYDVDSKDNDDDWENPMNVGIVVRGDHESDESMSGWAWFVIVLSIILCCICCCCGYYCHRRRRNREDSNVVEKNVNMRGSGQEVNVFMQNHHRSPRKPSHTSNSSEGSNEANSNVKSRPKKTKKSRSSAAVHFDDNQQQQQQQQQKDTVQIWDVATAVSDISAAGCDPPSEINKHALVLYNGPCYNPSQVDPKVEGTVFSEKSSSSTFGSILPKQMEPSVSVKNHGAVDPSIYSGMTYKSKVEPDGDKIKKKRTSDHYRPGRDPSMYVEESVSSNNNGELEPEGDKALRKMKQNTRATRDPSLYIEEEQSMVDDEQNQVEPLGRIAYSPNPHARDPTLYLDNVVEKNKAEEPFGDKVVRKESRFGDDVSMSEVRCNNSSRHSRRSAASAGKKDEGCQSDE